MGDATDDGHGGPIRVFLGKIIHCSESFKLCTLENGFVLVVGNKVRVIADREDLDKYRAEYNISDSLITKLSSTQILIPGLIDTHIHAPQYPNIGIGLDKQLLEWLQAYTYPMEMKFNDSDFARKVYYAVVKRTLYHGTTTACYFASLYGSTSEILADAAIHLGQRAFIGKVNMTRLAPKEYLETPRENVDNTRRFIEGVLKKKSDLVKPIITPRFALSLDMDDMIILGKLAKEYGLNIQTHISENQDEVKEVIKLYGKSYAQVYDQANLLGDKTVLAHAIYLTDSEKQLVAARGTSVSHCPGSNTCLHSGMCDVRNLVEAGITVGLGTDVSGGPSPSIVGTMRSAIDTSVHISFAKKDYKPLDVYDVFYLATLGGAQALALGDKVGNFEPGKEFDALIVDMDVKDGNTDYFIAHSALELLQMFIYTGDDRNIVSVYVSGKKVK